MDYKNLKINIKNGIMLIIINRPKFFNAINYETLHELKDIILHCKENNKIKVVILTGSENKAFIAGADISEMQNMNAQEAMNFMEFGHETLRLLEILPKPVIAGINGLALGGGLEIAMSCDIRFASENARFGQPEICLGLIPGWGGTQRLARLVGLGIAKELIITGKIIDAQRAYQIGLINRICQVKNLLPEILNLAEEIINLPNFALKMAKNSINFGYDLAIDNANKLEIQCCSQCFNTKDQKEGMKAFLEKRKPLFVGN